MGARRVRQCVTPTSSNSSWWPLTTQLLYLAEPGDVVPGIGMVREEALTGANEFAELVSVSG